MINTENKIANAIKWIDALPFYKQAPKGLRDGVKFNFLRFQIFINHKGLIRGLF